MTNSKEPYAYVYIKGREEKVVDLAIVDCNADLLVSYYKCPCECRCYQNKTCIDCWCKQSLISTFLKFGCRCNNCCFNKCLDKTAYLCCPYGNSIDCNNSIPLTLTLMRGTEVIYSESLQKLCCTQKFVGLCAGTYTIMLEYNGCISTKQTTLKDKDVWITLE